MNQQILDWCTVTTAIAVLLGALNIEQPGGDMVVAAAKSRPPISANAQDGQVGLRMVRGSGQ